MMPAKKTEAAAEKTEEVVPAEYPTPSVATTESKPKGNGLKYVGPASVRTVTKLQFLAAGITNQDTVTFSRRNNFTLKKSNLSKSALNALEQDNGFISVDL